MALHAPIPRRNHVPLCSPPQVRDVLELDVTPMGLVEVNHLSSPDGGGSALGPGHLTDVKDDWLDELQRCSNLYLTLRVSPTATQVRKEALLCVLALIFA